MAGQIKSIIDRIIEHKTRGDQALVYLMHAKLALKGIDVNAYTTNSPDDPRIVDKLRQIANDFGVTL